MCDRIIRFLKDEESNHGNEYFCNIERVNIFKWYLGQAVNQMIFVTSKYCIPVDLAWPTQCHLRGNKCMLQQTAGWLLGAWLVATLCTMTSSHMDHLHVTWRWSICDCDNKALNAISNVFRGIDNRIAITKLTCVYNLCSMWMCLNPFPLKLAKATWMVKGV